MLGLKFRRQHPIGPYIVDFVCLRIKVVIESDGAVHNNRKAYDQRRDAWLGEQGYRVLRINNDALVNDREEVLTRLRETLKMWAVY
jgi:very-short-patch-repair endonuclease